LATNKVFLDFDGTLISNKARLYAFYYENIGLPYRNLLNINEFWSLKKLGIHEIEWLNSNSTANLNIKEWDKKKLKNIESLHYLTYDKLFPFTRAILDYLTLKFPIFLVTRRSNIENLYTQLTSLDLVKYFKDVIIIPHNKEPKAIMLKAIVKDVGSTDVIVGDTEDDVAAGIGLGMKTFFVLSGIRGRWVVQKYFSEQIEKVRIIPSIKSLKRYL
jgi:phosphoglycolate phosphatase-like HAD superfamily hydrolase